MGREIIAADLRIGSSSSTPRRALRLTLGENPLQSEADQAQTRHRLESLDCLIVQDIFLTATAQIASVVFPAAAGWCESEGTVTNSEHRVQRVRKAIDPPAGARDDVSILFDLAPGWDTIGGASPEKIWDEVRHLGSVKN